MTAEQFAYWMQGFAELNEAPPTAEQWKSIREHLVTVFVKVTPPLGSPSQIMRGPTYPRGLTRVECKGGIAFASSDGAISTC